MAFLTPPTRRMHPFPNRSRFLLTPRTKGLSWPNAEHFYLTVKPVLLSNLRINDSTENSISLSCYMLRGCLLIMVYDRIHVVIISWFILQNRKTHKVLALNCNKMQVACLIFLYMRCCVFTLIQFLLLAWLNGWCGFLSRFFHLRQNSRHVQRLACSLTCLARSCSSHFGKKFIWT